jgi:hypothetical protein
MPSLAIFPLDLVVFPKEDLKLHVFEPRYRQLIADCEEKGIRFGIPKYSDGKVQEYGTEMEFSSVLTRYPKGESDIKAKGVRRFRILSLQRNLLDRLYSGAEVEFIMEDMVSSPETNEHVIDLTQKLFSILGVNRDFDKNPYTFETFSLAHHVGFSPEQEYEFLTLENEYFRQRYMEQHLRKLIPLVKQMKELQERIRMNGHVKNIIPPNF